MFVTARSRQSGPKVGLAIEGKVTDLDVPAPPMAVPPPVSASSCGACLFSVFTPNLISSLRPSIFQAQRIALHQYVMITGQWFGIEDG
jgi:hypothetical protein